MTDRRYLIVTPYYRESETVLSRCIRSVSEQTIKCDHLLVADGHPLEFVDRNNVRHIKLDRNHNDSGNTPRGIGCLVGIAEGYDGIGLLDADNWLERDHVAAVLEGALAAQGDVNKCDYVVAKRFFWRPDESKMTLPEEPDHIDTNCFFFLPGSFSVLPIWAMMPNAVSAVGDRIFNRMIKERAFKFAVLNRPTVNYVTLWAGHYRYLNEALPENAKVGPDLSRELEELASKSPREVEILNRLTGFGFITPDTGISRNSLCFCGSGKKYKHCHGQFA